jgi:hypothetical protein
MTIVGETYTVNQDAFTGTCTYTLTPGSAAADPAGDSGSIVVTTNYGCCDWTATPSDGWITITGGTGSGPGDGTVTYDVAENDSCGARSGSITIGGETFTITQAVAACTYSPANATAAATGEDDATLTVTTNFDCCDWSGATSSETWLQIVTGSGTGTADIVFDVDPNTTCAQRQATITVESQTCTVTQDPMPCTYSVPENATADSAGETGSTLLVTTNYTCYDWSGATSSEGWLQNTTGAGTGTDNIVYNVDENTTCVQRQATILVEGDTCTITQNPQPCFETVGAASQADFPSEAGSGTVTVTTNYPCCEWQATSGAPSWLHVTSGPNFTGGNTITFTLDVNDTGDTRTGTLTIAGEAFTIWQSHLTSDFMLNIRSNTSDGSTVFLDDTAPRNTVNANGDVQHSNSGDNTAIEFDGKGDSLSIGNSDDWNFGTGDFTIDLWVNFANTPAQYAGIFSTVVFSQGYLMHIYNDTIQWLDVSGNGVLDTGIRPTPGQWHHLAAVRANDVLSIYVDGIERANTSCDGQSFNSAGYGLVFGNHTPIYPCYFFDGLMDEITVTKGTARWTENFTPPNNPAIPDLPDL